MCNADLVIADAVMRNIECGAVAHAGHAQEENPYGHQVQFSEWQLARSDPHHAPADILRQLQI